jgi:phosphopantetheine adenylyltransferase
MLAPILEVKIFELKDRTGIAATNDCIQACFLTKEVQKGGKIINEIRETN